MHRFAGRAAVSADKCNLRVESPTLTQYFRAMRLAARGSGGDHGASASPPRPAARRREAACARARKEDMLFRRLAALIAAVSMVLMISAPVFANDLHQTPPISADDPAFQGTDEDCSGLDLQPGQVF